MKWLVLSVIALAAFSVARADNSSDAKAMFDRATVQFRLGQFHDAAMTYQKVYELHHDPDLLYNCAQSFRLAGEREKALLFYKNYLAAKPDAENRDEVRMRIEALGKLIAEPKRETTPPPAVATTSPSPTTPPAIGNGRKKTLGGVVLLGVAVAAAVGGIVAAVLQARAYDSINHAAQAGEAFDPSQESAGKTDTVVAGVLFGIAGAAAIAGGVLVGLGVRERRAQQRVSLMPFASPTALGATVGVRF